ncbi:hypothetical protein ACFFX0_32545 [Citricoccus parietis]|uniref:Uncharacterized protein n=1 Tax=Citricoccus parietis TaxID=592307 RepID=A0ABV5G9K8_9MICC
MAWPGSPAGRPRTGPGSCVRRLGRRGRGRGRRVRGLGLARWHRGRFDARGCVMLAVPLQAALRWRCSFRERQSTGTHRGVRVRWAGQLAKCISK